MISSLTRFEAAPFGFKFDFRSAIKVIWSLHERHPYKLDAQASGSDSLQKPTRLRVELVQPAAKIHRLAAGDQ